MTRRVSQSIAAAVGLIVVGGILLLVGSGLTAVRALAVFQDITETGNPGLLSLAVHEDTPLWVTVEPGDSAVWHVRASLGEADHGALEIELDAYGGLIDAANMMVRVDACTQQFDPATLYFSSDNILCSGTRSVVLQPTPLSSLASTGDRYQLTPIYQETPRELLVTLTVPSTANPQAIAGETAHVGLGVHANGESMEDDYPPPHSGELQVTGSDVVALGVLASGIICVVIGFALLRRSRIEAIKGGG